MDVKKPPVSASRKRNGKGSRTVKKERITLTDEQIKHVEYYASLLTEKIDIAIIMKIPEGQVDAFLKSATVDRVYQPALRKALADVRRVLINETKSGNTQSAKLLLEHAEKSGLL